MPYATVADMRERFGADEIDAMAARDAMAIARALADADAEVDAYLGVRYALPLNHVPLVLVRIACDIARYRLWAERASDEVRRRYEDARRFLNAVSKGDITLGLPDNAEQPSSKAAARSGDAPVFTRAGTGSY